MEQPPPDAAAALKAEGIYEERYDELVQGDIFTERRPVPAGKTGVHVAAFGIVRSPVDKLWNAIEDCGRTPEFMPHIESCTPVRPDHELLPNQRWEKLQLSFNILFFRKTATIVNEATLDAPNYLSWQQVRGDTKVNQGYYRIVTLALDMQLMVYDTLSDPGIPVPGFIKAWLIRNSLPGVITALRNRVETQQSRYASF
jgi:uncharacterized membrane protein